MSWSRATLGKSHACRALLDSGSQLNFVTEEFVKKLHLDKQNVEMPISGIAQGGFEAKSSVNLTLQSRFSTYCTSLTCIVLPRITQKLPQGFIPLSCFKIPANI